MNRASTATEALPIACGAAAGRSASSPGAVVLNQVRLEAIACIYFQ